MKEKIEPTDELASLIGDLHDSEINGEIGWFFDGVWRAKIGAPWNGYARATPSAQGGEGSTYNRRDLSGFEKTSGTAIVAAANQRRRQALREMIRSR
jgi:hypothetical protein